MEKLYTIKNTEILTTGLFQEFYDVTEKDLNEIIANLDLFTNKLPLKLGHADDQAFASLSGFPAVGWLDNIRKVGNKLFADLIALPKKLYDAIQRGNYRQKSVEMFLNVEKNGKYLGTILTGLAILGAEIPEVKTLDDLSKLYFSDQLKVCFTSKFEIKKINKGVENMNMMEMIAKMGTIADALIGEKDPEKQKALKAELDGLKTAIADAAKAEGEGAADLKAKLADAEAKLASKPEVKLDSPVKMSDAQVAKAIADATKAVEVKFTDSLKLADAKAAKADAEIAELKKSARESEAKATRSDIVTFTDKLKADGILPPKLMPDLVSVLCAVRGKEEKTIKFVDEKTTTETSTFDLLKDVLSRMPKVEFGDTAHSAPGAGSEEVSIIDVVKAAVADVAAKNPKFYGKGDEKK